MQKKIAGLVLAVSLIAPLGAARAAEVTNLLTNNLFAGANSTVGETTTSVFVTREKGKGQPRDSIGITISGPSGFSILSGTLPDGALTINKTNASVDVVISDIAVIFQFGDFPADGVVSVDWAAGDVERTSGNVILDGGPGVTIHIHGHRTFAPADIEGSVFGTALVAPTGDISTVHDNVKITFVAE